MKNILNTQNAKILLLGGVACIALEVFAYLLSQFYVGNFIFGLSVTPQLIYLLAAFVFCLVSISSFLIIGSAKSITVAIGAIITGIFIATSVLYFGYGAGTLIGLALLTLAFLYSGYDVSSRLNSSLNFSLRNIALPIMGTLSIGIFAFVSGVVFDYIGTFGLNSDYVVEYISDERYTKPIFEGIFASYGQFSVAERQLIMQETQKTFETIISNLISQANKSILGPVLGILALFFFFQIFNIVFVYVGFVILYILFAILKIFNFIKLEKIQKEAEVLQI